MMSSKPLVSIIIPVYNREALLPRLFDSLRQIVLRPIELVLVDNQSTDASYQRCIEFAQAFHTAEFIIKVASEATQGASACRNRGLHLSNGQFVYFFDSDDTLSPHFLSDMLTIATQGADMVCAPSVMQFPDGRRKVRAFPTSLSIPQAIVSAALSTQSMFFKRELIVGIGGWNEKLLRWNDWELGIRALLHAQKVEYTNRAYHTIYQHADSITGTNFSHSYEALTQAARAVENAIRGASLGDSEQRAALHALSAKLLLLSASLHREDEPLKAKNVKALAYKMIAKGSRFHFLSPLIYQYARCGGRGAWRLYACLL